MVPALSLCLFSCMDSPSYEKEEVGIGPGGLFAALILAQAGPIYAFSGRLDGRRHRTRQAVYKDIRRAATAFRLREHISPHSLRKFYAVEQYKRTGGNLKRVQELLQHDSEAVTAIYAMADALTAQRLGKEGQ